MQSLKLDFVGDSALRFLAVELCPRRPEDWSIVFGSNSFLSSIYFAVTGETPQKITNRKLTGIKFPCGTKTKIETKRHYAASCVEYWLGEAYNTGGIEAVKSMWQRMLNLISFRITLASK